MRKENPAPPAIFHLIRKQPGKIYLKKSEIRTPEKVLPILKKFSREEPLVFVCETGELSRTFSRKVRDKGWQNAYYVEGGLSALTSSLLD